MRQKIITKLNAIEKEYGVKILLAIESGSRAWGFPSNDSDYDVRFIYAHSKDWYLSIDEKRDVIEQPIDNVLDINGWDIRKSLRLMRKSNSPLLEWISSPIQYRVWSPGFECLDELSKRAFLPESSCHHYLSLAKNSIEKSKTSDKAVVKTYMYAIRPVLCCQWIIKHLTQPPMQIDELLGDIVDQADFKKEVIELVEKKKNQSEGFSVDKSKILDDYLSRIVSEVEGTIPKNGKKLETEEFNKSFRFLLEQF